LLSDAPIIPWIAPIDTVKIEKLPVENVKIFMQLFYERQESSEEIVEAFQEFTGSNLQFATYELQSTISFQSLDIEDTGQLVFDFVEVEIQSPESQIDFVDWLSGLSCSLRDTYYHA